MRLSEKSICHKFSSKPPNTKGRQRESNRLEKTIKDKAPSSHYSKSSHVTPLNISERMENHSEFEQFDSVGKTLSDGLKSLNKAPLHSYGLKIDSTNRSFLWKEYLEGHGGKYVIIDEFEKDTEYFNDTEDKNVIRKIEISTLITTNSELYSTNLDLSNQQVLRLDVDRTRNSIKHCRVKAEKMLTLF
jgi:hypothetical protein